MLDPVMTDMLVFISHGVDHSHLAMPFISLEKAEANVSARAYVHTPAIHFSLVIHLTLNQVESSIRVIFPFPSLELWRVYLYSPLSDFFKIEFTLGYWDVLEIYTISRRQDVR